MGCCFGKDEYHGYTQKDIEAFQDEEDLYCEDPDTREPTSEEAASQAASSALADRIKAALDASDPLSDEEEGVDAPEANGGGGGGGGGGGTKGRATPPKKSPKKKPKAKESPRKPPPVHDDGLPEEDIGALLAP